MLLATFSLSASDRSLGDHPESSRWQSATHVELIDKRVIPFSRAISRVGESPKFNHSKL
jgi:hypothetical protein